MSNVPSNVWDELFKILRLNSEYFTLCASSICIPRYATRNRSHLRFPSKKALKIVTIALVAVVTGLYFGVLTIGNLQEYL